jgi:Flavodoxins
MKTIMVLCAAFCIHAEMALSAERGRQKVLVVYYSRSGRTRAVAERLQAKTGADIYEIRDAHPYPESFQAVNDVVRRQLAQDDFPDIVGDFPDLNAYDVILIGAPVWWHTTPPPVSRYLKEHDFAGKKVAGFCTYETNLFQYQDRFKQQVRNGMVKEGISISFPNRMAAGELESLLDAWLDTVAK